MNFFKNRSRIIPVVTLIIGLLFSSTAIAQNNSDADTTQANSVLEIVESSENHTIFEEMLNETELANAISDKGPYTVIAPTDDAFESMGNKLEEVRNSRDMMQKVVSAHLYQGKVDSSEVEAAMNVDITNGNIDASNGYVHVTDAVVQRDE